MPLERRLQSFPISTIHNCDWTFEKGAIHNQQEGPVLKLRIRGNSIRIRMSRREVAMLASTGSVEESVQFSANPDDRLFYVVETSHEIESARAWGANRRIGVTLPQSAALSWAETDQIGIENLQPIADTSMLRIVVEKDFQCLRPRSDEDESDNFPNRTQSLGYRKES